ncbi:hypothetical protein PSPO01_03337 [Paraphaeosphaeria sporulosa]
MSFLCIIPLVWGNGARMFFVLAKKWLRPLALSSTDSTSTILLTECEKYTELLSPALPCSRSRPGWMTRGFDAHTYQDRAEHFPAIPIFDTAECEEAAMRAAHAQAGLLPPARPLFAPDLTPIDGASAVGASYRQDADIFIHAEEARDALHTSLHFAAGKARSRYQHNHPAFASPKTPWLLYSSPLAGEMTRYTTRTFQDCRNSIRVAPPSQIRLELETCLILAFAPYLLSNNFRNANGKNTIVPKIYTSFLEEQSKRSPHAMRNFISFCEEGLVEDGEDLLQIWAAWRWVVTTYVGILVLRHRQRPREEIAWF